MTVETKVVEVSFRDIIELLLHGAVYDEANDTERKAALRLEEDNTLRVHTRVVGETPAGLERPILINPDQIAWIQKYENYIQVDGVELGAAEAVLWDPGGAVGEIYAVEYNAINIDVAADTVLLTIGHGVGGAALTDPWYWADQEILPQGCSTDFRGPFLIGGNDTVRGNAAAVNDIAIQWRIKRVDVGA